MTVALVFISTLTVFITAKISFGQEQISHKNHNYSLIINDSLCFDKDSPSEDRVVGAAWLKETAQRGVNIYVENAIIKDPIDFRYFTFEGEVVFKATQFLSDVQFSYATFKRIVRIQSSTFHENVDFSIAKFELSASFDSTTFFKSSTFSHAIFLKRSTFLSTIFKKDANFESILAEQSADFSKSVFMAKTDFNGSHFLSESAWFFDCHFYGKADFAGAKMDQACFNGSIFKSEVSFNHAEIKSGLLISDCKFDGPTNFAWMKTGIAVQCISSVFKGIADFNAIEIEGSAFFRRSAFHSMADFRSAHITSNAEFVGATFKKLASFNGANIDGSALFMPLDTVHTTFEGKAEFGRARIGGQMSLRGAVFKDDASFRYTEIRGQTYFRDVRFFKRVLFIGTKFFRDADFRRTVFSDTTEFNNSVFETEVTFISTEFQSIAKFEATKFFGMTRFKEAKFHSKAIFDYSSFNLNTHFATTEFLDDLSLFETTFRSLSFSDSISSTKFGGNVDLRGCVYDRLEISSWKDMLDRQKPYERQPYVQLEKVLRYAGKDEEADKVYRERRIKEGNKLSLFSLKVIKDRALRWFFGYGILDSRVLWISLAIVLFGSFIFWGSEESLRPKDSQKCPLHSQSICKSSSHNLSWFVAFWVSLKIFLPMIDIIAGNEWEPTHQKVTISKRKIGPFPITYSRFAACQRILGWFLIPMGIAYMFGFLKQ